MSVKVDGTSIKELTFIQFVNVFSLFVAAGAVSTSYFFVQYYHASMPISFYWVLASGIWIIYTLDHLVDGIQLGTKAVFLRHAVHYRYRKILIPTIIALALFNVVLVFAFFDQKMITLGLVMGALMVLYFLSIYFLRNKRLLWFKEIFIAVMVTAGMLLFPGLVGDFSISWENIMMALILTVLNFTNLIIFAYFDQDGDAENKLPSMVIAMGEERSRQLIYELLGLVFVLLTCYVFFIRDIYKVNATISILLMMNILLLTILFEDRFKKDELYRFWGDFIYLIPGLVLLVL